MRKINFIIKSSVFRQKQVIKSIVFKKNKINLFIVFINKDEFNKYSQFKLRTMKRIPNRIKCYVNGKMVYVQVYKSVFRNKYIKINNSDLLMWENIIAFPKEYKIKRLSNIKTNKNSKLCLPVEESIKYIGSSISNSELLTINYINASRIIDKNFYRGLFYPAFDIDNNTFRLTSWIWCNSILIKMILELPEIFGISSNIKTCKELVERLCSFQITEGVNSGAFLVRYDLSNESDSGIIPWLAPNDSAFIASNALIPMYKKTNEQEYLKKAIDVANWILNFGITSDNKLLVGYREDIDKWDSSWLYVDAGFTINLFVDLYNITGEIKWKDCCENILKEYINMFYLGEGRFIKVWKKNGDNIKFFFTRGFAWALDGIISFYELSNDNVYFKIITETIEFLALNQNGDGSWNYILNNKNSGIDNKAISILSYHILRASKLLNNKKWVQVSKKAIDWCRNNITNNHDQNIVTGYISATNYEGDIIGKRFGNVSFLYSSAYYLLSENLYKTIITENKING